MLTLHTCLHCQLCQNLIKQTGTIYILQNAVHISMYADVPVQFRIMIPRLCYFHMSTKEFQCTHISAVFFKSNFSNNKETKLRISDPLCWETTDNRWFPAHV